MAQERPNRLAEWVVAIRAKAPEVRQAFVDWWDACRAEPILFWETAAVRYTTYLGGGVVSVWVLIGLVGLFAPPAPASARPEATTADYHVICAREDCGHHFLIHRKFGFSKFPVACASCDQPTGERAVRCSSKACGGRWFAAAGSGPLVCPWCSSQR